MYLLTIIIPNYNSGKYLKECLDALLGKDISQVKIIVVDNLSSDESGDYLHYIKKLKIQNIHIIRESDTGQSNAINKAIPFIDSKYMMWLNSDDRIFLDVVLNEIKKQQNDFDILVGNINLIDRNGIVIGTQNAFYSSYKRLLLWNNTIPQMSTIMRTDVFLSCGGLDEKYNYCMDYDLWLRSFKGTKIKVINKLLAEFRIHEGSKTFQQIKIFEFKSLLEMIQIRIRINKLILFVVPIYFLYELYKKVYNQISK